MDEEKIIEIENQLIQSGVESADVATIMEIVNKQEKIRQQLSEKGKDETADAIRMRLIDEKDWRKRASLSAMLISKSLE